MLLTKFDAAERQLNQGILLFFEEGDPISIHTIVEAALQILYDIRGEFGGEAKFREHDRIKPEFKKEWLAALARAKNFFKHADRDAGATIEFDENLNHTSMLEAVDLYLTAKKSWTPETIVFVQWFSLTYPEMIIDGNDFADLMAVAKGNVPSDPAEFRSLSARMIRALRDGSRSVPGIDMSLGRPSQARSAHIQERR